MIGKSLDTHQQKILPDLSYSAYFFLMKPRLLSLIVISCLSGYIVAAPYPTNWEKIISLLFGCIFTAGGANAFNQVIESKSDGKMLRTRNRPLPSNKISFASALIFSLFISGAGIYCFYRFLGQTTAGLGVISWIIYIAVYTPLKKVSVLNTWFGAIPGALPPLIGAAAGDLYHPLALKLFFIIYFWQIPHFLSLAWKYRDQYRNAGFKMISKIDETGHLTAIISYIHTVILIGICIFYGLHETAYIWVTGVELFTGGWLIFSIYRFDRKPDLANTNRLFGTTIKSLSYILVINVSASLILG